MTDQSDRLSLPYIMPSQAQKHVTHNEAVQLLDVLVQLTVTAFDATTPPAGPVPGDAYVLGTAPVDAWTGHAGEIAVWASDAWLFVAPQDGWHAVERGSGTLRILNGGVWVLPAAERENLPGLGVGTTSDSVNRLAVASEASLYSHAGAGHQIKVNKAASGDTASVLFQTDWSGRAEFGLAGDDDFSIKVSEDNATWHTVLNATAGTGHVGIGAAADPSRRLTVAGATQIDGDLGVVASFLADGHVGIGLAAPVRRLHVTEAMRLEPAAAPPPSPAAGDLYFDATTNKLRCHDGTSWRDLF